MERRLKKRSDIEGICVVVNKDDGLDKDAIATVVEKMYTEGMLKQKFHTMDETPTKSTNVTRNMEVVVVISQTTSF